MTRTSFGSALLRVAAFVAALALALPLHAQDEEKPKKRTKRAKPSTSILEEAEKIQKDVEAIRGLTYRAPVVKGVKTTEELKKHMIESFEKEESPEEYAKQEKVAKQFHLIPRDYDLRAETLALLSEQIAGFYDPDTKQLFCITRADMPAGGGAMGIDMNELTMAHELEHALQDQYFDIRRRSWLVGDDDDRSLAYRCVEEGEATLVGYTWLFKNRMGQDVPDLSMLNNMERQAQKLMPREKGKKKVPDFIMENLTFPYLTGAEFVQKFQKKFGWEKCGSLFTDPPSSSAQVLHPKKYWGAEREEPLEIKMPNLTSVAGTVAKELVLNGCFGEFNVQHVLRALGVSESDAAAAAIGWRGDRYEGIELKTGKDKTDVAVAWVTTWASEHDAEKFESAYRKALGDKLGDASLLERRATEVVFLDNVKDAALRDKLWRAAWSIEKATVKREPIPSLVTKPAVEDFTGVASGATGSSAAAPALGPRVDDGELGISFMLPQDGFTKQDETLKDLQHFSRGKWTHGDATLRVLDLPIPFDPSEIGTQFEAAMRQGVKDFKKKKESPREVAGHDALEVEFEGTIPGYADGKSREAKAVAVEREGMTLLFLLDAPAGKLEAELAAFDHALATLDVETTPAKGERRFGTPGEIAIAAPPAFEPRSEEKPIVLRLEDGKGASIMVQELAAKNRSIDDEANATEAFLERELPGYKALGRSEIVRDKRRAIVLEYEAKADSGPKRVRMVIATEDGRRMTLACAAPSEKFDNYRTAFQRAVATFRLGRAATEDATKRAPTKHKGKLY